MNLQQHVSTRSVLIVDDFDVERACYRRYLSTSSQHDYLFFEAEMGETAFHLYQLCHPDVILVEYHLLDSDAPELIRKIRESDSRYSPAIIVMAEECKATQKMAAQAMRAGAQAYLVKETLTSRTLRATVNRAVDSATLHTQIKQRLATDVSHVSSMNLTQLS